MIKFKLVVSLAVVMLCSGCGQRVVETLNVPQANVNGPGAGRTIVVLPFADYTSAGDIASAYRRNLKVNEALTDRLSGNGFSLPVEEDVFGYLIDRQIISVANYEEHVNASVMNELKSNDWSAQMKETLSSYIGKQSFKQEESVTSAPGTHALDQQELAQLGHQFNADYILRGRILEFRSRQDATWAPWRRGLFPVIAAGGGRIMYGFAGSTEYDSVNQMLMGGILGASAGNEFEWPLKDGIQIDGGITGNEIAWATAGSLLGKQAARNGKVDQAVVQLRVWVQDATTGQVVWTNRAMVRVSPESIFSDGQWDDLYNTAIEKGVNILIDNFVTVGL